MAAELREIVATVQLKAIIGDIEQWLTRHPFAMKVFSNREAAAAWLADLGGSNARAVTGLIRQLEGRFAPRTRDAATGS